MWNLITSALQAVAAVFGFQLHRSGLNNSQEMQQRKVQQDDQNELDRTNKAIADSNLEHIRKDLAE